MGVDDCGVLMSLIFDSMSMISHFHGRCRLFVAEMDMGWVHAFMGWVGQLGLGPNQGLRIIIIKV